MPAPVLAFQVIDECLSVQNAAAKRCPSAWRQIEVSECGVLMLSATFFRSKFDSLFYMIRMLRSPLPRTLAWLPATIHEHIVCQVPETDRSWTLRGEPVPLPAADLARYRRIIESFKRQQLNTGEADGRKLCAELEAFLREAYEGRVTKHAFKPTSVMGEAFARECSKLIKQGRRPLVFADTAKEAEHLLGVLSGHGLCARMWADVASESLATSGRAGAGSNGDGGKAVGGKAAGGKGKAREAGSRGSGGVIVALKSTEGHGINMQHHADAIICRPTPGDHLEQMKGRVDRPGQTARQLVLVVLMAEHTIEEAKYANIRLAGNFFREYIAPVATRYRERIDLEAMLAAGGTATLKRFTVCSAWHKSLEAAGQSGAFAAGGGEQGRAQMPGGISDFDTLRDRGEGEEGWDGVRTRGGGDAVVEGSASGAGMLDASDGKGEGSFVRGKGKGKGKGKGTHERKSTRKAQGEGKDIADDKSDDDEDWDGAQSADEQPKYRSLNTVLRNKGDPEAVRQAKSRARAGLVSRAVRRWLFPPKQVKAKVERADGEAKPLPKDSPLRFSDRRPPLVLTRDVLHDALAHLSQSDPKLEALIARVGARALEHDVGGVRPPTQARLFNKCLRAITFTMVSVDAGNAFLRRLSIKLGVALEQLPLAERERRLATALADMRASKECEDLTSTAQLLELLLAGHSGELLFTVELLEVLVLTCEKHKGKQTGYPHLCGVSFPCGKNDDHQLFLEKAREHVAGDGAVPVSAGYSKPKADFLISLVADFKKGAISGAKMAAASDREAAQMLVGLQGIGDWSAGGVLMHFLGRADVMLYGDLTIRNYLNDLYDISHKDESETLLESAADFADNAPNRNLIDAVAKAKGWAPYRSVVCYLMYHLQEENLVLL